MTSRPERPVPSPKALAGRKDPARSVRPVDWTAVPGRRPEPAARPEPAELPSAPLPRRRARTVELPRAASAAPSDAVHTLDADDPRPLPRPLRIRDEDIRAVGVTGADGERIVQAVADPEDAWTADAGTSDHFLRGDEVPSCNGLATDAACSTRTPTSPLESRCLRLPP